MQRRAKARERGTPSKQQPDQPRPWPYEPLNPVPAPAISPAARLHLISSRSCVQAGMRRYSSGTAPSWDTHRLHARYMHVRCDLRDSESQRQRQV